MRAGQGPSSILDSVTGFEILRSRERIRLQHVFPHVDQLGLVSRLDRKPDRGLSLFLPCMVDGGAVLACTGLVLDDTRVRKALVGLQYSQWSGYMHACMHAHISSIYTTTTTICSICHRARIVQVGHRHGRLDVRLRA